jgi:N-acetylmuramoyl-L-alanine amidase
MPLKKNQLNSALTQNQQGQPFGQSVIDNGKELGETQFAKNATVFGGNTGGIFAGIESMETKIDNPGETAMGDAMCSFGDQVNGLGGVPDPTSVPLDLSVPTITVTEHSADPSEADSDGQLPVDAPSISAGATESQPVSSVVSQLTGLGAPTAKLESETLGASSLDAISATASDVEGKQGRLKGKIQAVASETKAASGTGGGASGGLGAITSVLKKAETMVEDIIKDVSSIPSVNPKANPLTNVTNNVSAVNNVVNKNINELSTNPLDVAKQVTTGKNPSLAKLQSSQKEQDGFFNRNPIKTGLGLLQDMTENITNDASQIIRSFTSNAKLPSKTLSKIIGNSLSGSKQGLDNATQETIRNDTTLTPKMKSIVGSIPEGQSNDAFVSELNVKASSAGISQEEITAVQERVFSTEEELSKLDTTISGTLITTSDSFVKEDYDVSETLIKFNGQQTAFDTFTYIDSKEELGTEFRMINRPITEMIVHASDTYTNQNIGSEELHVEHNQSGMDGIGYHLVIRRDGRLQRGRPYDTPTETTTTNGHGKNSIDICLVGGLNCSTGCENPDQYRSSQSFTREQMTTLESICEAFFRRYHGGQVFGHNEIQPLVTDPYFSVSDYVETVFRKVSVYDDLETDTVLSAAELITKRPK